MKVVLKPKPKVIVSQKVIRSIDDLTDVDAKNAADGDLLIYDEVSGKFVASNTLEKQVINGGNF